MSDYLCPFCAKWCGPDYSDYTDHVYDEHPNEVAEAPVDSSASCENRQP